MIRSAVSSYAGRKSPGNPPLSVSPETAKLEAVDALRGLAVFGVLAVHTAGQVGRPIPLWLGNLATQGARGVQLFYIVSAFTLTLSLTQRSPKETRPIRNFFIRRLFRIAPMFYLAVLFYLWKDGLGPRYALGDAPGISTANIIATVTFTNGWNPYWINSVVPGGWSVAVEMSFYLVMPFLFQKIRTLTQALWLTCASLIGSIVLNWMLTQSPFISHERLWHDFLFLWLPSQFPVFCLGLVLFFLFERSGSREATAARKSLARWLSGTALFLFVALAYGDDAFLPGPFLYGVAFLALAFSLLSSPQPLWVNPFWCRLGQVSFSVYLTHFAILPYVGRVWRKAFVILGMSHPVELDFCAILALGTLVTMAFSTLTFLWVECPGQHLGRWLVRRSEASAARSPLHE